MVDWHLFESQTAFLICYRAHSNQANIRSQESKPRVDEVTDLVNEIAVASSEQAQAIGEINTGLGQIDLVTQSNTANSGENAAAAEELSGQAEQLRQILVRFKLDQQADRTAASGDKGGLQLLSSRTGKTSGTKLQLADHRAAISKEPSPRDIIALESEVCFISRVPRTLPGGFEQRLELLTN